jgi:uncharacterized protein
LISFDRLATAAAPTRLLVFIALLALLWLPFYGLILGLVENANTASILAMSLLFVEFIVLLWFWSRRVYRSPHPLQRYGLQTNLVSRRELLTGLGVGLLSLLTLFGIEGALGWVAWQTPSPQLPRLVLEGLLISLGVGLGEELIFRGWLLSELEQDYSLRRSRWADSLIFAALHYTRPIQQMVEILLGGSIAFQEVLRTLPQFPGLVLLGCLLVWAKRSRQGRLALPIGLHAGLVWGYYIVNVGELVRYTDRVPEWVTGIDKNPLAGGMGMLFLAAIALWVRWQSRRS